MQFTLTILIVFIQNSSSVVISKDYLIVYLIQFINHVLLLSLFNVRRHVAFPLIDLVFPVIVCRHFRSMAREDRSLTFFAFWLSIRRRLDSVFPKNIIPKNIICSHSCNFIQAHSNRKPETKYCGISVLTSHRSICFCIFCCTSNRLISV